MSVLVKSLGTIPTHLVIMGEVEERRDRIGQKKRKIKAKFSEQIQ